ncbi:hypothetical protein NDU88_006728 [Pleurodeles waltl]|uniref:t-SNARE coiled-coil homology domain-containing protein n=1 Tax=Pleurodeles waltl TaxID=8319 RepID=A0AAV7QMS7_PLEWA|nr:hypothetical protein NDU88_006728 [Pleurodeles waltl]
MATLVACGGGAGPGSGVCVLSEAARAVSATGVGCRSANMSSDFEGYEQDYSVLSAEITGRIARIPKLAADEKKQMVAQVEKQLEEAKELLEQMDLEVREIPAPSRAMYGARMRSYKQELSKLEVDFKRSRIAYSDEVRNELLGDDGNSSESQRAHLLDNTERLERSSRRLEAGYQIAVETEQIGQDILENLNHDREKIQRARERLRETDTNLGKSSRILTGMLRSRWSGDTVATRGARTFQASLKNIQFAFADWTFVRCHLRLRDMLVFHDHPEPCPDRHLGDRPPLYHHTGYLFFIPGTLIALRFTRNPRTTPACPA